jgi:hypothetical protein
MGHPFNNVYKTVCRNIIRIIWMAYILSKNSFLLRTAAISSVGVVRPKFVLDIALAMPAAILTFRLAGENFARSRDKSNF